MYLRVITFSLNGMIYLMTLLLRILVCAYTRITKFIHVITIALIIYRLENMYAVKRVNRVALTWSITEK